MISRITLSLMLTLFTLDLRYWIQLKPTWTPSAAHSTLIPFICRYLSSQKPTDHIGFVLLFSSENLGPPLVWPSAPRWNPVSVLSWRLWDNGSWLMDGMGCCTNASLINYRMSISTGPSTAHACCGSREPLVDSLLHGWVWHVLKVYCDLTCGSDIC